MSQNDDENTDDGIWRATIQESHLLPPGKEGFNTDDGIWRATIQIHKHIGEDEKI